MIYFIIIYIIIFTKIMNVWIMNFEAFRHYTIKLFNH